MEGPCIATPRLHLLPIGEAPLPFAQGDSLLLRSVKKLFPLMDKERRQGKGVFWLLQTKAEEEFIGVCEFNRIASCESGADVGCRLRTRWRGKGYMREALDAVIDYGFTVRRFTALYANIEPDNVESERLFQSLGFFPCGKISGFFGRRAFRRFVLRIGESG